MAQGACILERRDCGAQCSVVVGWADSAFAAAPVVDRRLLTVAAPRSTRSKFASEAHGSTLKGPGSVAV